MSLSVFFALLVFACTGRVLADYRPTCHVKLSFVPQSFYKSRKVTELTPRYLNCSLEQGKKASRITWKLQDQILKQATGPIKWLGLSLDKVAAKRVENLRCIVMVGLQNNSCGISPKEPPHITSRKQIYEVYVGTSLVIPCRATGNPEPDITWMKTDQSFAAQDMPASVKQIRSRANVGLAFKKVSMMHSGIYKCHAVNRLGKDAHFVLIIAQYYTIPRPPRVVPLKRVITVQRGTTAVLVCSGKNTPRRYTALFWKHYDMRVMDTARHRIKSRYSVKIIRKKYKDERVDTSLTISHVTSKDVGLYTCGVVTHVGRDKAYVDLRIKE